MHVRNIARNSHMQRKMPMMRKEFITGTMDRDSAVMICRIGDDPVSDASVMTA